MNGIVSQLIKTDLSCSEELQAPDFLASFSIFTVGADCSRRNTKGFKPGSVEIKENKETCYLFW